MKYGKEGNQVCKSAGQAIAGGTIPPRDNVSVQILQFASQLENRASHINAFAHDKLVPIMRSASPEVCSDTKKPEEEYPPLFLDLRTYLQGIECSLNGIESALSRSEV